MVHPYHAVVIDRYLLPDSPERIVIDGPLGGGALRLRLCQPRRTGWAPGSGGSCSSASTPTPRRPTWRAWARPWSGAPDDVPDMVVSVMAANTMGSAWFDGVTPVMGPPRWTHLWEQGFSSLDALEAYRHGDSTMAAVERAGWDGGSTASSSARPSSSTR